MVETVLKDCESCEETRECSAVMFPRSTTDKTLVPYWWCEDCESCWLGTADMKIIATTGVIESIRPKPN
jgi:hypothetical protein